VTCVETTRACLMNQKWRDGIGKNTHCDLFCGLEAQSLQKRFVRQTLGNPLELLSTASPTGDD